MSADNSKQKGIRVGLAIIIVILVLLGGIQLFLSFYLDSFVENRLTSAVDERTNGQYELKTDDLNLNIWNRSFVMQNVSLRPVDTASTAPKINLEEFRVSRIGFIPYLFRGKIQVGDVQVLKPAVSFVQSSSDSLTFLQSRNTITTGKKLPEIEIDQFVIENGSVTYWKPGQDTARGGLHDFHLNISDIRVDSASRKSAPYFKFADIQTRSGKIHYELDNGFYTVETDGMDFSTAEDYGSVDSLRLIPKYPRYEFYQAVGHQTDRIDLTVEKLLFENPDIETLNQGKIKLEKLAIENANLDVFRSKELARPHKQPKKLAFVAFKDLNIPITIDTIAVNQANISYTEQLEKVTEPGTVTFANVNGTFTDVTNDSAAISRGHIITLDVTSEVMNAALLEAHFEFPMHKNGSHTASGHLGRLDTEQLNPILVPVGLIRAESGIIHSLDFEMNLGPQTSSGWVQLVYSDLKIDVLDAENVEVGGRQFFKSILANLLKVKDNNDEEPLRKGEVSFERVEYKAIFNYWWKSLASGLKDNIGI